MKLAVLFSSFVLFFVGSVHYPLTLPRPRWLAINFLGILVSIIFLRRFSLASSSRASRLFRAPHWALGKPEEAASNILPLTHRFHVAVRLFSNRSQMTSKCGKNKEVAQEPQASVSVMFLPHFDVFCDVLLNRPGAKWNLFVLYNDQKRIKTDTHTRLVPLDCSRICASLRYFSSPLLLFFFFILLVNSLFEKFFNVFTCSKQNNGKYFAKQRVSCSDNTRSQLLWSFLACSLGILKLSRTLFVSVFLFLFL